MISVATSTPAPSTNARRLADLVARTRELGIVAVLLLLVVVTSVIQPNFIRIQNIQFILLDTTMLALIALGETMVVTVAGRS